jgi:Cu(I)/Ag(I) efflux system membrane fusion protein
MKGHSSLLLNCVSKGNKKFLTKSLGRLVPGSVYFCCKVFFMKISGIIVMGFVLLATACNNGNTGKQEQKPTDITAISQPVASRLNDTGTQKLVSVVSGYYALKNALVATNESGAGAASGTLEEAARNLQGYLLNKEGAPGPMKPFLDTILLQAKTISGIHDKTCEQQRVAFGVISSAIYGLLKNAELRNMKIYHTFCPMAFNEKGATWLSEMSEIKNPYFGDKMLECGEITDTLK